MYKILFGCTETEYLGFWVSKDRVISLSSKAKTINAIDSLTKVYGMRWFIGIINYYWYMWCKRTHILASLTNLFSAKVNFK